MDEKSLAVIIGAANITEYDVVKEKLEELSSGRNCYYVYCDGGLNHEKQLGYEPNLIIGDFDSHANPNRDTETIVLPVMKDDTDTVYAVKEVLKRGYEEVILIGVIGQRMDHSLGNISVLLYLYNKGAKGYIIDDYSIMELVAKEPVYIEDKYPYFSLLAVFGTTNGVHEVDTKYPLNGASIEPDYQYGISNEVLKGKTAKVWCEEGTLLLVKDF